MGAKTAKAAPSPLDDPDFKVPDVPGMSTARVVQLLRANGSYSALARLAAEIGEPHRKLLCQWHRVRAAI